MKIPSPKVVAACADETFILSESADGFVATLTDPVVIAEIEQSSEGAACTDSAQGDACVDKQLPWEANVQDGTFTLKLSNGSVETMRFSTSYPGSTVYREGDALRMELRNAALANSQVEVRYVLSNHLFDGCIFPADSEQPEQPVEGTKVLSCDDGALVVESAGTKFKATITDSNIVAYIEQESQGTACAPNNGGCVTKRLPFEATIQGETLTLQGLTGSVEQMTFVTSYPGSTIERQDQGVKLELRGAQLANSSTEVRYEIANWFFQTCDFL